MGTWVRTDLLRWSSNSVPSLPVALVQERVARPLIESGAEAARPVASDGGTGTVTLGPLSSKSV